MKRPFNRTKVAKKNKPKIKRIGKLKLKVPSKNTQPEYSKRGTRAKGKSYKIAKVGIRTPKTYNGKMSKEELIAFTLAFKATAEACFRALSGDDQFAELDCD